MKRKRNITWLIGKHVAYQNKRGGGLGIINLDIMNKALIAKWLWKLETGEGIWTEMLLI